MSHLFYALGAILPLFLMIATGYALKRKGFLSDGFNESAARFNFRFCFPAIVFDSLYAADLTAIFSGKLAVLSIAAVLIVLVVAWISGAVLVRDKPGRGSFIQGAFRGNIVLMAMPMAIQVFGEEMRAQTAILMAMIVTAYNVLSVIVLTLHASDRRSIGPGVVIGGILTNPMILGLSAALPFALGLLVLPEPLRVFIGYFSAMAIPLALVDVGSGMAGRKQPGRIGVTLVASSIKTILGPVVYGGIFALAGVERSVVAVMFLLGSAPTAMVGYTMAKAMGCDAETAGDIILVSTLMSAFTMAASITILRMLGFA